ncbi:MAG: hypothetical protein KJ926_00155, partial [Candidatus Omnitrophica bacterium]|nr:hypothetical protein [Candidatus Omnitrophota bacterium]
VSVKFKAERSRLNDSLKKALKEKEEVKSSLIEKEKRLNELRDIQGIKSALSNSQGTIEQLSREIDRLRTEKSALQETNLSISSRLQNLTREFSQILEESRRVKDDLGNVDKKFISPLKKKMEEFEKAALIKDDEIDKQKNELAKLKQAQVILMDANKELQVRLGVSKKDTSDRGNATQAFIDNINKLKASLAEKENQVRSLESEVSRAKAGRLPSNLKEPGEANGSLQLTRLSEILARKELDLDQAKKEAKESIAKITALQNRITVLEKNLSEAQIDRDKFKEVEAEKVSSQYRLRDMKDELAKKNDLADSLQKNLNYLTQQLTKFEDENKSLQLKLARLQETDLSFNSLKMQVNQLSDFVAAKEKELSDRRKEMDTLRDEVASLRLRSAELEKELAENRARQRKTLDDLSTVLKLNAALQERNSPSGQSITGSAIDPKVKQKSDDLKRKIEVILESDKQN